MGKSVAIDLVRAAPSHSRTCKLFQIFVSHYTRLTYLPGKLHYRHGEDGRQITRLSLPGHFAHEIILVEKKLKNVSLCMLSRCAIY